MKILLPFLLLLALFSCKKKGNDTIVNEWTVNSLLERSDTLTIFPEHAIDINFKSNKTLIVFSDSTNCNTNYNIESGELIIDSLTCTRNNATFFENKLIPALDSINRFKVQNETLFLYGNNQLTIKCLLK